MSTVLAAASLAASDVSAGETIAFWVLGPLAVLAALGMVMSRSAVHGALLLAVDMLALAVFYGIQGAPFLMFVQVIVYTGAIMMLFLFVLMLVGVDSSDSLVETLRGQRLAAGVLGLGFALLLITALATGASDLTDAGLTEANRGGNVLGLAQLLFTRYVIAFEVTSALLITAALGAMVLTHRERLTKRPTQRDLMRARFQGPHPTPLPGPGVYARHDAVDTPALLPDGSPSELSVVASLRGTEVERRPEPAQISGGTVDEVAVRTGEGDEQ